MKKETKRLIALIVIGLVIISFPCKSQVYLGISGTNKGTSQTIGWLSDIGIDLNVNYKSSLLKADVARILSFNIGKRIELSQNNFNVTPYIGIANYRNKDFRAYDIDRKNEVIQINETGLIYRLELGKDWYMGRLYIEGTYCNGFYFGAGIKAFIQ